MDHRRVQFRDGIGVDDDPQAIAAALEQLQTLFQTAAFWAKDRSIEGMAIAIAHSKPVVTVWDGEQLIGFARAISDGIYRATIWDVVIHPDYQGSGLGRKLVQTVLAHPHMNKVERVYLMTTHQQQFYERIGFQVNSSTTMVLYQQSTRAAELIQSCDRSITASTAAI